MRPTRLCLAFPEARQTWVGWVFVSPCFFLDYPGVFRRAKLLTSSCAWNPISAKHLGNAWMAPTSLPCDPRGQLRLWGRLPPNFALPVTEALGGRLPNRLGFRRGGPSLVTGLRDSLYRHKKGGYGMTLLVGTLQGPCSAPN